LIEDGYYLKRRAYVVRKMIRMTIDLLPKLQPTSNHLSHIFQDIKEEGDSLYFYADELLDSVNDLLNLHISLASFRTNEVVRILTLFSVFFMPLTFIAGIYGMNFDYMPELRAKIGYPAVLIFMLLISVGIFTWFRRKGWLK